MHRQMIKSEFKCLCELPYIKATDGHSGKDNRTSFFQRILSCHGKNHIYMNDYAKELGINDSNCSCSVELIKNIPAENLSCVDVLKNVSKAGYLPLTPKQVPYVCAGCIYNSKSTNRNRDAEENVLRKEIENAQCGKFSEFSVDNFSYKFAYYYYSEDFNVVFSVQIPIYAMAYSIIKSLEKMPLDDFWSRDYSGRVELIINRLQSNAPAYNNAGISVSSKKAFYKGYMNEEDYTLCISQALKYLRERLEKDSPDISSFEESSAQIISAPQTGFLNNTAPYAAEKINIKSDIITERKNKSKAVLEDISFINDSSPTVLPAAPIVSGNNSDNHSDINEKLLNKESEIVLQAKDKDILFRVLRKEDIFDFVSISIQRCKFVYMDYVKYEGESGLLIKTDGYCPMAMPSFISKSWLTEYTLDLLINSPFFCCLTFTLEHIMEYAWSNGIDYSSRLISLRAAFETKNPVKELMPFKDFSKAYGLKYKNDKEFYFKVLLQDFTKIYGTIILDLKKSKKEKHAYTFQDYEAFLASGVLFSRYFNSENKCFKRVDYLKNEPLYDMNFKKLHGGEVVNYHFYMLENQTINIENFIFFIISKLYINRNYRAFKPLLLTYGDNFITVFYPVSNKERVSLADEIVIRCLEKCFDNFKLGQPIIDIDIL